MQKKIRLISGRLPERSDSAAAPYLPLLSPKNKSDLPALRDLHSGRLVGSSPISAEETQNSAHFVLTGDVLPAVAAKQAATALSPFCRPSSPC